VGLSVLYLVIYNIKIARILGRSLVNPYKGIYL